MQYIDKHYEQLTKLYLRLKGCFVTNLIIHSKEKGTSKSELDVLAVRMPFHSQNYRSVEVEDLLELSNERIEIIIADVKNVRKIDSLKFNKGLRSCKDSIKQLVEWLGIYENVTEKEIESFEESLNIHKRKDLNGFLIFNEKTTICNFTIKFTFFCPKLDAWNGEGFKYIHGDEMIDFCWECLNISNPIEDCAREYNYENWNELEIYVRFFKEKKEKVSKQDFEDCFKRKKL